MKTTKAITLELEPPLYDRLEAEANRLGLPPAALAGDYVRTGLDDRGESDAERRRRIGVEALDQLRKLTADLPPIDVTQILEESRRDLEERPFPG